MSRYISQNLPHTVASNITLYTTFINHWVVSPGHGTWLESTNCSKCALNLIARRSSLIFPACIKAPKIKIKKTRKHAGIFHNLSVSQKTSSFQGKKTYRKSKKKQPPFNRQVAVDDNGFEQRHAIGRIDLIEEDQDLNVATSAIKSVLKRHKSMLSYRCLGVKYGKWN